jgi:hypothetical protein
MRCHSDFDDGSVAADCTLAAESHVLALYITIKQWRPCGAIVLSVALQLVIVTCDPSDWL